MAICSDPLALNDEELLQYVLDEEHLTENRQFHLIQCPICQQRLASYQETHYLLFSQLYRLECPSATQLSLHCGNMLSHEADASIRQHLSTCLRCNDEVNTIHQELARFAFNTEQEPFSLTQLLQKSVHRIKAHLTFQLEATVRQEEASSSWPRYYQSPVINLSLHLSYTSEHQLMLIGTLLYDDDEQARIYTDTIVELYKLKDGSTSSNTQEPVLYTITTVNELGDFSFTPLQEGHYEILMKLPEVEIFIDQLKLA